MWFGGWALIAALISCAPRALQMPVQELDPAGDLPLVRAWCGDKALRMGADSGSELPLVLFSDTAEVPGEANCGAKRA